MLQILITILPVFLVLGSGYAAVRSGYLPAPLADALNSYTVKLAVPVLLFRAMYNLDFAQAFHGKMLISFYSGAVLSFLAGIVFARLFLRARPGEAVSIGFGALFSNTVLLGIPIAERAFGETVLTSVFGIISLHAACMYALGMISMELARRDGIALHLALKKAARSIIANSLMIGVIAGVTLNFAGITLPEPVSAAIDMIATSAIPAALVGIGAALTRYKVSAELSGATLVTVLSLVVHPAIALALSHYVFDLEPVYVQAAVVVAAMPPGMNIYIFAVMYNRAIGIAASSIVIATTCSIATIAFWIAVINHLVP